MGAKILQKTLPFPEFGAPGKSKNKSLRRPEAPGSGCGESDGNCEGKELHNVISLQKQNAFERFFKDSWPFLASQVTAK